MSKQQESEDNVELREAIRLAQLDFSSLRLTFIENVMRVMTETFQRVKISLILPKLIGDPVALTKVLSGTEYQKAIPLVGDFIRRRDIILREKRPPLMDHGMIRIIDYFQVNSAMYTLFPVYMNSMSATERKLLTTFEKLMQIARTHLDRDAKTQIQHERELQGVFREKAQLQSEIEVFEQKLKKYYDEERAIEDAKLACVAKLEEELKMKKELHEAKIARETELCRRDAQNSFKLSQEKQFELMEELEKIRFENEKQIKDNKKRNKEASDEKNKLIIQLQGIIRKYDNVIGDKITENVELTDELNVAKAELKEFMVLYRKEAAIYNEIVVKREKEEERKKLQTILLYSMNRAARIIQRYWLAWRNHMKKKNRMASRKKK